MEKKILVIGATGDVGRGIAGQLLRSGYQVIAVGRGVDKLRALQEQLRSLGSLEVVAGSVENEESAAELAAQVRGRYPGLEGIVVSVNAPVREMPLASMPSGQLLDVMRTNVTTHLVAAKALIPILPIGGTYLAIGGGMADHVFPGLGAISMCQAAQRVMFKVLATEMQDRAVRIHELMLYSMIAGESNRGAHHPKWITDEDVGRHVVAILQNPDWFSDTILSLKSRAEAGYRPVAA